MSRPQVIDDQEHERVHDRVAAIDVAKDSGMVCTRTPHPSRPGARRSTVWTVKARMGAVRALGRQLARDGIEMVTLESTSTTGVSGFSCWRRAGWRCSWSTPLRLRTCPVGPRPTAGRAVAGPADRAVTACPRAPTPAATARPSPPARPASRPGCAPLSRPTGRQSSVTPYSGGLSPPEHALLLTMRLTGKSSRSKAPNNPYQTVAAPLWRRTSIGTVFRATARKSRAG